MNRVIKTHTDIKQISILNEETYQKNKQEINLGFSQF